MTHQHATLEDTLYLYFASNAKDGDGDDGASAAAHVRLGGAAAGAAPVLSPSPTLLTHASYPAGAYEVAVAATAANGFAAGNTYGVFSTLAVDTQNPTGFIGSFSLKPIPANVKEINSVAAATPGAAGGLLIAGSNAATTFATLTVSGATTLTGNVSMAAGLNITQSSANTSALVVTGNGTGHGAIFTSGSGATGDGIKALAASTNGNGLAATGTGSRAGILAQSGASGAGFECNGLTNGVGFGAYGSGTGAGFEAVGGATGRGIAAYGGATSGNGFHAEALSDGHGGEFIGAGTGKDINADITGNITGTLTTVTNLTNAPTAGDLTATMKTSVQTAATASLAAFFTSAAQLVTDIWAATTRILTAGTNIVLAKGVGVTGFNDLSAAQVNAEADTALADYDPPTHAELTAELATADDAVLAAVGALRPKKNTAISNFKFKMVLTSDHITPATGLAITATRSIDTGAFASCTNAAVEISAGWYRIDLSASDMNGDSIALKFSAATADQRDFSIITQP